MKIPSVLTMISELIAIPSISCTNPKEDQSNKAVIDLLAHWCQDLGFKVEILPVPEYSGKFNLVATLGSGDGGLVLSGHTDTVPYDFGAWQSDPFKLKEADNRLYGLGTSDMKAFFALALTAAAQFSANSLTKPLIILATADEETSMSGARALAAAGYPKARHSIIGEPTGLRPVRMHKGIFMEAIKIRGLSGHSSDPSLGNSALEAMYLVIEELRKWRTELQARYNNPFFAVPVPTMNLGHIHGGDNPNRICADCELHLDLRPLPGMAIDELRAILRERIQNILKDSGLKVEFVALFQGIEAIETPAEAEIVQIAERLTNYSAESVAFATEAPYLKDLGMDTIILGPGNIAQAHQPDEFITLKSLQPMIDILTQMIKQLTIPTTL